MSFTSQNEADAIVMRVAAQAAAQIVSSLILGKLVHRDYAKTAAQAGDAVNITPIANAPQPPPIVLKTEDATFQIPDVTKALDFPDLLKTHTQPAVSEIAGKIDTDIAALYSNFTANPAVGSLASITETVIDSAEALLLRANAPQLDRFLVVSPRTFSAMCQISRFTEFQRASWLDSGPGGTNGSRAGDGPMGAHGKVGDFLVFQSESIQKPSSTTYNMGLHRDALCLAVRGLPLPIPGTGAVGAFGEEGRFGVLVVTSWAQNSLAQQFAVQCLYGCAVIRNNFGIQVHSNN